MKHAWDRFQPLRHYFGLNKAQNKKAPRKEWSYNEKYLYTEQKHLKAKQEKGGYATA
jgi:hypothetical protein